MASSVYLGIRLYPKTWERIKVEGINLAGKVSQLRAEASRRTNISKDGLELIYCGNVLDDDANLSVYGIKAGVMVHVLRKKEKEMPPKPRTMKEAEIKELVLVLRAVLRKPAYRSTVQRLSQPEVLDNIVAATPGLANDPVAMAMLQDPDLLVHLTDPDTVRRVVESHPSLAEAASEIAAAVVRSECGGSSLSPTVPSGYSYSLDALSDDEEMDSTQGAENGSSGGQGSSGITPAQLAAALAAASSPSPGLLTPSSGNSSSTATAVTPTSASSSSLPTGFITPEMFSQAMQAAIANVGPMDSPQSNTGSAEDNPTRQLIMEQLRQMQELGIVDDALSLRALEATDGDVQSAVELIFNGWIGEEENTQSQ